MFDPLKNDYSSIRQVIYGKKGMVATTQPLAAQIGIDILKKGGNAVDAAVATAIAMTILEPTSNGIGGDAFALVYHEGRMYGLNGSGPAPALATCESFRERYGDTSPEMGMDTVTVPGCVASWVALSERFGRLPFKELVEPAIGYAREGYPVSPVTAHLWGRAYESYKKRLQDACYKPWFDTFAPEGRAPRPGEVVRLPLHAKTLEEIAETKGESFYRGAIAKELDAWSKEQDSFLRAEDLASYEPEWVTPIQTTYRGYQVLEIPPNGHGLVALMALNIFEHNRQVDSTAESYHQKIEAMKLAFTDGKHYVSDPKSMRMSTEHLLSKSYAKKRYELIGERALEPIVGDPSSSGTIYLCTADEEGNMVSFIQSNYMGFGSGMVVPGTGIALHNRGANFSLDPEVDNCIAPGKRPYHTIIPGFLMKDGVALGPFGVMGGFMQPQGHFQVVTNLIDHHLNPQQALDAPRWQWTGGMRIEVEEDFPEEVRQNLAQRGHQIKVVDHYNMGRGQIILRNSEGVLMGATEKRADGSVASW